jgi:hypothetical protein
VTTSLAPGEDRPYGGVKPRRGGLVTTKRDKKKDEPKAAKRPKLKKETLKDLEAKGRADGVRGGVIPGKLEIPN